MTDKSEAGAFLPTLYQQQIHQTKYARWRDDLGRREQNWAESIDRLVDFFDNHLAYNVGYQLAVEEKAELRWAMLSLENLASMRALNTAGEALKKHNVAAYNCAYVEVSRPQVFDEALYILCCGTGLGFSVERQFINKLPEIPEEMHKVNTTIIVRDSKIGWASAFRQLISLLYAGQVPSWDTSRVRVAGSVLKTFGGRASGPGPLEDLFRYTVQIFQGAIGRKLTSEECHGIMCKVGDIVVSGGVRRSALLSLSNPSDDRMRDAKSGQWFEENPHYRLANNSAAWTEKPDIERFLSEWVALVKSKSGERGIFNREAAIKKVESIGRDPAHNFGVNPCGEIILRDREFCNLSEVVVRADDTFKDLCRKVRVATILGTIQSTFTDFTYLSSKWQKNCEEERLLGVSMTGIQDNPLLNIRAMWDDPEALRQRLRALNQVAQATNSEWAKKFDIPESAARCCVKPSGNGSQLVDSASGIGTRHGKYYIRRNVGNKTEPVAQVLKDQGIPCEPQIKYEETAWVFSYPIKAPEGALTRNDVTAIDQLEHWLIFSEEWCDHNPSITINVRDKEWLAVGDFVYTHFDKMIGVTFLPYSNHTYQQAPYEEITEAEYEALVAEMPEDIDWTQLHELEKEDRTESARELACVSGSCEL